MKKNNNWLPLLKKTLCLSILGGLVLFIFLGSYKTILISGSGDLRNRIVGTRAILWGKNPYTYRWHPGDPVSVADPLSNPSSNISRLSVPPTMLLLHIPLAYLSFDSTIILWFFLEWVMVLYVILSMVRMAKPLTHKRVALLVIVSSVLLTVCWTMHVYMGQIYILYAFILFMVINNKTSQNTLTVKNALLLGILAAIRPPYICIVFPFLLKRRQWPFVAYFLATGASVVLISAMVFGAQSWKQYGESMFSMERYFSQNISSQFISEGYYPKMIEGVGFLGNDSKPSNQEDSFRGLYYRITGIYISTKSLLLLVIAVVINISLYVQRKKIDKPLQLLLIGVALSLIIEMLLPIRRYLYADVQLFALLGLYFKSHK